MHVLGGCGGGWVGVGEGGGVGVTIGCCCQVSLKSKLVNMQS